MNEKHDFMDVDDNKTKSLAEVINNKTCKRILNYLREKGETSETNISKDLNMPLSTVNYNLKKLKDSRLVRSANFQWSPKGNKVYNYAPSDRTFVFSQKKSENFEMKIKMLLSLFIIVSVVVALNLLYFPEDRNKVIPTFNSCSDLKNAFHESRSESSFLNRLSSLDRNNFYAGAVMESSATGSSAMEDTVKYSETNIQVEGVDEADIVKTDGEYIYIVTGNKLVIARAYPSYNAKIASETYIDDFRPSEILIHDNKLLIFGSSGSKSSIRIFDINSKENLVLIKSFDFEGNYLTSRKIGSYVYFVISSRPDLRDSYPVPLYEEDNSQQYITSCDEVGYFEPMPNEPINAERIISVISLSLSDVEKDITKEVIAGSGKNAYASMNNLYLAESDNENTNVHKFGLNDGKISYLGYMKVPGKILNQFSMDEYDNYFRIATTIGRVSKTSKESTNNIYIYDDNLNQAGKLEGLAQGEKIYSVRFMGKKAYMVTFKKVDPLFVIDLSDPKNPKVLGELKIPGYSDYIHPYDDNHIIGIGKDTVEAEEGNFAWYQGIKIALFDVSDVNNPKELHKVVIGDRGTNSEALRDHKAFLFDMEKNLLVIPVEVAESEYESVNSAGNIVFTGSYVYELTISDGFDLKGKVEQRGVKRNLYIENVLYTISNDIITLTLLEDMSRIRELTF